MSDYSIARARLLTGRIDGFLLEREGRRLYELARMANGHIIEIGAYKGKSTVWLACGSLSRQAHAGRVFSIDPHVHGTEAEFRTNLDGAGVSDHVTTFVMKSADVAVGWTRGEIGMVWIDGSHRYNDVAFDFRAWSGLLRPGGILAIHDSVAWYGPRRVVDEELHGNPEFSDIRLVGSLIYAWKKPRAGPLSAFQDKAVKLERHMKGAMWTGVYGIGSIISPRMKDLRRRMALR